MSDFLASPSPSPGASPLYGRAGRQSFSGLPVVRSPPIPIPRKQKIRRSASFTLAQRDSGFVGSDESIFDNSPEKFTPRPESRRAEEITSFALTPVSPDDADRNFPSASKAHLRTANGDLDSSIPRFRLPAGEGETEGDDVFVLPPSPVDSPSGSPSSRNPRSRNRRRPGVVRIPSSSRADSDVDDGENGDPAKDPANGGLFVPSVKPLPSSPSIPIPTGSRGGHRRRERIDSNDSFVFVEMPTENNAEVAEMHESLQYHLVLSGQEERPVVETRAPIMFVPPFSPRRSSHLAGSPSPWRHPAGLINRASGTGLVDGLSVHSSSLLAPCSGLALTNNGKATSKNRHPSLDGDSSLSLGDDVNSDRSLEDRTSAESVADSVRPDQAPAIEDEGMNGARGASGGAGSNLPPGGEVDAGRMCDVVGGAARMTLRGIRELDVEGAANLGNVARAMDVGRESPPQLLPRQVQSLRQLPDIVPRNDRRFSAPAHFDAHHPMARQIGVELCRIADEIEAQFIEDEGAAAPVLAEIIGPGLADVDIGDGVPVDNNINNDDDNNDEVRVLHASASAPSALSRIGSSLARRISDWHLSSGDSDI